MIIMVYIICVSLILIANSADKSERLFLDEDGYDETISLIY